MAGTGTWIVSDGRHFILTALHVWDELLKRADQVGITVREGVDHRVEIDPSRIAVVALPRAEQFGEWGPDLALLSVPAEAVGQVNLYRAFWNPARDERLGLEVLETCLLMGTPGEFGRFTETRADLEIDGMFLGPEVQQTRGNFDYLDYEFDLTLPRMPRNFGGVSGGGVWRVWLYWHPSTGEIERALSLHGVAFYQLPIISSTMSLVSSIA